MYSKISLVLENGKETKLKPGDIILGLRDARICFRRSNSKGSYPLYVKCRSQKDKYLYLGIFENNMCPYEFMGIVKIMVLGTELNFKELDLSGNPLAIQLTG
jgi:hypothetical protein